MPRKRTLSGRKVRQLRKRPRIAGDGNLDHSPGKLDNFQQHNNKSKINVCQQDVYCICCLGTYETLISLASCSHTGFLNCFMEPPIEPHLRLVCIYCHSLLKKIQMFKNQIETSFQKILWDKAPVRDCENKRLTYMTVAKHPEIYINGDINQYGKECKGLEIELLPQAENPAATVSNINDDDKSVNVSIPMMEAKTCLNKHDNTQIGLGDSPKTNLVNKPVKVYTDGGKQRSNIKTALDIIKSNEKINIVNSLQAITNDRLLNIASMVTTEILKLQTRKLDPHVRPNIDDTIHTKAKCDRFNTPNSLTVNKRVNYINLDNKTDLRPEDIKIENADDSMEENMIFDSNDVKPVLNHIEIGNTEIKPEMCDFQNDSGTSKNQIVANEIKLEIDEIDPDITQRHIQTDLTDTKPEIKPIQPEINPSQLEIHPSQPETSRNRSEIHTVCQPEKNLSRRETSRSQTKASQTETSLRETETGQSQTEAIQSQPGPSHRQLKPYTFKQKDGRPIQVVATNITKRQLIEERELLAMSSKYLNSKYKCETCIIGFAFRENIINHNERKHKIIVNDTNLIVCNICYQVLHRSYSANHEEAHYLRYECQECYKRFQLVNDAKRHVHNHKNCQ